MDILSTFHLLHWISALNLFTCAIYCLKYTKKQSLAVVLFIFLFLSGSWAVIAAFIYLVKDMETLIILNRIKMAFIVCIPVSTFALSLKFHGTFKVPFYFWCMLCVIPFVSFVLLAHPQWHLLFIQNYGFYSYLNKEILSFSNGPWFVFHIYQARILIIFSIFLIFRSSGFLHKHHRVKAYLIALSILIPTLGDFLAVFWKQELRYLQITPTLLSLSGVLMVYAVFKYHALEVVPFARWLIVENIPDPYIVIDNENKVLDFNPASQKLFQLSNQALGKSFKDVFVQENEFKNKIDQLNEKNSPEQENVEYTKDFEIYLILRKILNDDYSDRVGTLYFLKNITQEKRVENELRNINDMKTKFMGILAHDLLGNVRSLSLVSESLMKDHQKLKSEDIRAIAEMIYYSSTSINDFIESLLLWAKAQLKVLKIEKEKINLLLCVNEVSDFLSPIILDKNLDLEIQINENLIAYGDKNMISTLFRNLISNAIKFSQENSKINIIAVEKEDGVEVCIEDNGCGLIDVDVSKVFHFQDGKTINSTSGLGFVLCEEFVRLHGGKIWAENKEKQGSRFYFTLPLM